MPNEQIKVPLFAASEILTAANMNLSAGTGVPVFATTVTRDAAFGGAGEKALAEGQLCYLSSTNVVQYYDGAAWASVGPTASALVLVKAQVIGSAVSSVAVTGAFSTTYDTYKIVVNGGVSSASVNIGLKLGSTTTGYYYSGYNATWTGTLNGNGTGNGSEFATVGTGNSNIITLNLELVNPFLADETMLYATKIDASTGGSTNMINGYLNNQTSYTDFTLTPASGTLTGGTIYVYGYAKA